MSNQKPKNILSESSHLFIINKQGTDDTQLMVQSFEMPTITLGQTPGGAPKLEGFQIVGTKMQFDPLILQVLLDEDLQAWYQMYSWMKELVDPKGGNPVKFNDSVSQAQLHILTNNKTNQNIIIEFKNIWPTTLSGFTFATNTTDDIPPMVFDVTFNFDSFRVRTEDNLV